MDEIPIPYKVFSVEAPKQITQNSGSPNGRVGFTVAGAEAGIYLGCDGVFDKPVIIVEGVDAANSRGLNYFLSIGKYGVIRATDGLQGAFATLHQSGYDRVIVNF